MTPRVSRVAVLDDGCAIATHAAKREVLDLADGYSPLIWEKNIYAAATRSKRTSRASSASRARNLNFVPLVS